MYLEYKLLKYFKVLKNETRNNLGVFALQMRNELNNLKM